MAALSPGGDAVLSNVGLFLSVCSCEDAKLFCLNLDFTVTGSAEITSGDLSLSNVGLILIICDCVIAKLFCLDLDLTDCGTTSLLAGSGEIT